MSGLTQSTLKFLHFYEYTGMLSKHRSQGLWLALMMHFLFHFGEEGSLSDDASDAAMKAAINFMRVSCEQIAMITGKGSVEEVIQRCQSGQLLVYIKHLLHATTHTPFLVLELRVPMVTWPGQYGTCYIQ